jgi:hypothetical protein
VKKRLLERRAIRDAQQGHTVTSAWPATSTEFLMFVRVFRSFLSKRRTEIMLVEDRPVTSIQPYENNPRVNDPAVDAVAESIKEFGFRQPIVVDEQGVILEGHTRFKAALKLGLEQVPVHVARG